MPQEHKRLDALIVDVEDSTTLLKLYIGRLMKAPARAMFYAPLVEHTDEVAAAVRSLDRSETGREQLVRIALVLCSLVREFSEAHPATIERILTIQEAVDLLEAQLEHMLRFEEGGAPEVVASLERLEAAAMMLPDTNAPRAKREETIEDHFEEDPFDEFALTDEFLDELVGELDMALPVVPKYEPPTAAMSTEAVALPEGAPVYHFDPSTVEPGQISLSPAEEEALKELFAQIASAYVAPITDFVAKLSVGPVTNVWIDVCLPAVASMARASASMGYASLEDALNRLGRILEDARSSSRVVDGDTRAHVLATYQHLAELMPSMFPLVEPDTNAESESIILNSLLKQIKGVGRVTIGRLFAVGLVTLDSYYIADPGDLAAAAGLRLNLATTICEKFRAYGEVSELAADTDLVVHRLEGLMQDLRAAQFDYKKATLEEWYTHAPSRAKAKARRARQQCMWKINVALAELGEVDFVNSIKDEIYDKRLERIEALVASRRHSATDGAAG